ncbi:MAG: KH domain-containing protein [Thermoanaerobaculia bacterium]|nr:KH domain-containing protein [Thermoanaerobaculia bacterium]
MKDLVEFIAKSLVDQPDQVRVDEVKRGDTTVVELRVAPDDLGRVIGRQGRTARAMRNLIAAAERGGSRTILDILD